MSGSDICIHHGGRPAFKAALPLVGLECGPCRAPLPAVDQPALLRELCAAAAVEACQSTGKAAAPSLQENVTPGKLDSLKVVAQLDRGRSAVAADFVLLKNLAEDCGVA